ncbi:MAG: GGDEF domain-containing protein [Microbacteriaceae bacterium]|nr:GGDEF domain-containing protein [Burkholderiaceae bacterium]
MSELIDQLACLTRLRDIDALDVAMCALAQQRLGCRQVAIHRLVSDGGSRRWLTTARAGDLALREAPCVEALGEERPDNGGRELPPLDARPAWRDCLQGEAPWQLSSARSGTPHTTLHPMATDTGALGVMELRSATPPDAEALRLTVSLLGFHRHLRGLMDENERDSLTGLLNRRTFGEAFVRAAMAIEPESPGEAATEIVGSERRASGPGVRHWLAVVDIDHFKRVNDLHGHLIGDAVLLLVAQLMRTPFRDGDRISRFGGEEFVVLLRCPAADTARMACERLRQRIERHSFPQVGSLTVSIGFTAIGIHDSPGAAFERADRAVYQAKQIGRNRTVADFELAARAVPAGAPPRGELEFF